MPKKVKREVFQEVFQEVFTVWVNHKDKIFSFTEIEGYHD